MSFHVPEHARMKDGPYASGPDDGNNGAFIITVESRVLTIIASDGAGWEHVSVSTKSRCPNWREMDAVKRMFWDDEDAVMQLHVPRSSWVNNHPYTLHLWRPINEIIPLPPSILVGFKELNR